MGTAYPSPLAAITIYNLIQVDYFRRVYMNKPLRARSANAQTELSAAEKDAVVNASQSTGRHRLTANIKWMLVGLAAATVWIYIRSIYRTIEVSPLPPYSRHHEP